MKTYKCKNGSMPGGSNYMKVMKAARLKYHTLQSNPKRLTYVRSKYFKKDKVFIDQFWIHLMQKRPRDRVRRLRLYSCAIELITNSNLKPTTKPNPNRSNQLLCRFGGQAKSGELFYVQIAVNNRTGRKDFLSIAPK